PPRRRRAFRHVRAAALSGAAAALAGRVARRECRGGCAPARAAHRAGSFQVGRDWLNSRIFLRAGRVPRRRAERPPPPGPAPAAGPMQHPPDLQGDGPARAVEDADMARLVAELADAGTGHESDLARLLLSRVTLDNLVQFCALLDTTGTVREVNGTALRGA